MKAIQLNEYVKTPFDLKISDIPDPVQGDDNVIVQIKAASANFYDLLQIKGKYQTQPQFPWIAGGEFAGVVLSAPVNHKYKKGDRVFGYGQGAFAEKISVLEHVIFPIPQGWSFEDASGLFLTAPTGYTALVDRARLKKGETCLVHAAAGGVGLVAVQVAKALGATVIATASTEKKLQVAKRFGADHLVNYTEKDWTEQVRRCTPNNKGVDVVYDPVGLVDKSLKCIAWKGRIVVIGFAAGNIEKVALNRVLLKNCSLVGFYWGGYHLYELETVWDDILKLIAAKKLCGIAFEKVYKSLENVPAALNAIATRESWGKVVIRVNEQNDIPSKL
ncbi:Quinone oxidoreductase-like protein 2 [Neolecta irregularis DAH-3]|uniref:Quinone oxidoreductase-like protein 2 n=1 Tax=Neolecta irregularis (strain DAH-3) TaxID=1198029 RepID=A0A1U7LUD4_NEOID|nr:Quinone oxidoreductase-like protein 2 [Neolecta irregularis DAH-3]|eukprot:OLL26286.1 Quinone oxidoreductase-like protein 2 [Neolecta irregularis DAH-3]